ncbi:hypothetical protein GQ53DRAFT_747635 [Thozetella sp. PMI_491]|nr:hypothetical protein GQ53DRAFT_747635 [Thozetella sp. PMI_491]
MDKKIPDLCAAALHSGTGNSWPQATRRLLQARELESLESRSMRDHQRMDFVMSQMFVLRSGASLSARRPPETAPLRRGPVRATGLAVAGSKRQSRVPGQRAPPPHMRTATSTPVESFRLIIASLAGPIPPPVQTAIHLIEEKDLGHLLPALGRVAST